jgi:hypothetical protein
MAAMHASRAHDVVHAAVAIPSNSVIGGRRISTAHIVGAKRIVGLEW